MPWRMNTARMTAEIVALEGWTQSKLGTKLGVSQATVSRWLKGQDPEGPTRDQLRDLHASLFKQKPYGTFDPDEPDPIIEGDPPLTHGSETGASIPEGTSPQLDVTGGMGAGGFVLTAEGVPGQSGMTFAADHISGYWRLPDQVYAALSIKARDTLIIPCQGNSMLPTLQEGDMVFVDTRHRWPSPDGIYALADDFGGIIVKTLRLSDEREGDEDGPYIDIVSDNPDQQRYPVKRKRADDLRIIGRVVRRFSAVF